MPVCATCRPQHDCLPVMHRYARPQLLLADLASMGRVAACQAPCEKALLRRSGQFCQARQREQLAADVNAATTRVFAGMRSARDTAASALRCGLRACLGRSHAPAARSREVSARYAAHPAGSSSW